MKKFSKLQLKRIAADLFKTPKVNPISKIRAAAKKLIEKYRKK